MKLHIKKVLVTAAVAGVMSSSTAFATNGYFAHGYSTKEKGLAGAGVAYSQDAMAAATNPAGMAFVGERMDVGLALFAPSPRSYTVTGTPPAPAGTSIENFCAPGSTGPMNLVGPCQPPFSINPGTVESENDLFFIPQFAYNWQLDSKSTAGISIYGNGGMNTEYSQGSATTLDPTTFQINDQFPGPLGAGTAGVNLAQMFFNASYARKLNDTDAWGASAIFVYQKFAASGLEGFGNFSNDASNLSGNRNSYSTGFGFKLGYQGEVAKDVRVGFSYQSKMSMSEFEEYSGLFAEGGDFDIPATATLGIAWDVTPKSKLVMDIQTIYYSDVAAIANPIQNLFPDAAGNPQCIDPLNAMLFGAPTGGAGCLGGSNGAGFGWTNMTIIKIGYQWNVDGTDWRVGISQGDSPIPENQTLFNILAPAVIETHITFGFTMPIGKTQEFNFAAMYAPNNSVSGINPFDGGATTVEIEMSQYEFQAGWAWKY